MFLHTLLDPTPGLRPTPPLAGEGNWQALS